MSGSNLIYLDYQASTPVCHAALEAMMPYMADLWANPHSSQHLPGITSSLKIEEARLQLATLIGADANEIIFTSGATEANNLALLGLRETKSEKRRVLVSAIEHKAVLAPADHLATLGFKVEKIPVDAEGVIDMVAYEEMLGHDVLLVSIMAINNETGSVQPIKLCAQMAKKHGALFHTDAAQAPLHMDIDVHEWDIDLLSLSGHKMYGPKGVGFLYVSNFIQEDLTPIIFGGGQERGFRSGTLPTALCVGFGSAAKFLLQNKSDLRCQIKNLRNYFWQELTIRRKNISLIGQSLERRHIGNLCIAFEGSGADEILGLLQADVAASTGSACSSGTIEPSHVLTAMGLESDIIESSIRFSFGPQLTQQELDEAIGHILEASSVSS